MIDKALTLLSNELEAYLQTVGTLSEGYVSMGNVAQIENEEGGSKTLLNKVILTLVNVEEESAFKNLPNFAKTLSGGVRYQNPPVYLNLYLLFAAHFPPDNYTEALRRLSYVIQFFQGRHVFNLNNTPSFNVEPPDPDLADIQLTLDMYTMTFEQINHLWGSLGGRQLPFVMYKARLVKILDRQQTGSGALIEEVGTNEKAISTQSNS